MGERGRVLKRKLLAPKSDRAKKPFGVCRNFLQGKRKRPAGHLMRSLVRAATAVAAVTAVARPVAVAAAAAVAEVRMVHARRAPPGTWGWLIEMRAPPLYGGANLVDGPYCGTKNGAWVGESPPLLWRTRASVASGLFACQNRLNQSGTHDCSLGDVDPTVLRVWNRARSKPSACTVPDGRRVSAVSGLLVLLCFAVVAEASIGLWTLLKVIRFLRPTSTRSACNIILVP